MAPSFPSERKRGLAPRTGLLTCAISSHLPTDYPEGRSPQWLFRGLRAKRNHSGWFPALPDTTGQAAEALTVAGQWRSFTAFPSILAIAEIDPLPINAAAKNYMEQFSMSSTFIAARNLPSQRKEGNVKREKGQN